MFLKKSNMLSIAATLLLIVPITISFIFFYIEDKLDEEDEYF